MPVALFGGITNYTISTVDLIAFLLSAVLLFIFALTRKRISKNEGTIFLMLFVAYYSYVIYMH